MEHRNWADYRLLFVDSSGTLNYKIRTWCHGSIGIGLSRLGIQPIWENKRVRDDLVIALETAKEMKLQNVDHLCCGNLGLIDFLIQNNP